MRKTINVKEPPELELSFSDGSSLLLRFDMKALSKVNDLPDGLETFLKEKSIPERCAIIIFIATPDEFTLEQSRSLVASMDTGTIMDIILEFNSSMGSANNELMKDIQKKTMQEFTTRLSK